MSGPSAVHPTVDRVAGAIVLAVAALSPVLFSQYFTAVILTQVLFLGIVAASLVFLSAYGGMVSLAQASLFGIAGFVVGNAITTDSKGLNLGYTPWLGVVLGVVIATGVGVLFGAIASRSVGIYFLMITLTFSVLTNYFFGQVTDVSGFGGISGINAPGLIGDPNVHPYRLYYAALVVSLACYLLMRYVGKTPFGIALKGVRDEPVRMTSLGYAVPVHRMLAFGFAAFVASLGGVLFVWWNGHIDPASVDLSFVIEVLVIAVIGGLHRIEGAWLGALVYVFVQNYSRDVGFVGDRFDTLIGTIFLVIVLVSPNGLMWLWERLIAEVSRLFHRPPPGGQAEGSAGGVAVTAVGETGA
jgi:branched-chain amino acid transport system permease protein